MVRQRKEASFLPIIQEWVQPNTTIYSDCWAAYNNIQQHGLQHGTVNHEMFC